MKFNEILEYERANKNINKKNMALQIGVLPDTYRKYEKGIRQPDFDTLCSIADILNVSTDYLLGRVVKANKNALR